MQNLTLNIQEPGQSPSSHLLVAPNAYTLGRSDACDIVLSHPSVSRTPVRLEWSGTGFDLVDTANRMTITVNGYPLDGRRPIRDGDIITIADVRISVQAVAAPGPTRVAAANPAFIPPSVAPPQPMGAWPAQPQPMQTWTAPPPPPPTSRGRGRVVLAVIGVVALLAAAGGAAVVLAGGSGDGKPAAVAATATQPSTAAPTASAAPAGTAATAQTGPSVAPPPASSKLRVVVYTDQLRTIRTPQREFPVYRVVAHDLQNHRDLARFEVGAANAYPEAFALSPTDVVVVLGPSVVVHSLETGTERTVVKAPDGGGITGIAPSHDGKTLAVGVAKVAFSSSSTDVVFLELATGREIKRLTVTNAQPAGFRGAAAPTIWHADDRAVEIVGITYSESPGTSAAVSLDGTLVQHPRMLDVDSTGRVAALESAPVGGCNGPAFAARAADLLQLNDSKSLGSVTVPGRAIERVAFSPDGAELLVWTGELGTASNGGACVADGKQSVYLWSLSTRAATAADEAAVRTRWGGSRSVQLLCPSGPKASGEGLTCGTQPGAIFAELRVGDATVGRVSLAAILGFLDLDPSLIKAPAPLPMLVVTGTGADCLNVRDAPAANAKVLGCFKDGVPLEDTGEKRDVAGVTWRGVAAPTGVRGWASAGFLIP